MATYQRFEELPVWAAAAKLYDQVDDFIDRAPPRLRYSFLDQLERATLSVSNNIAEGLLASGGGWRLMVGVVNRLQASFCSGLIKFTGHVIKGS